MQIVTYVQALFPLVVMLRSCPNMTLVVEWDFLMQCTGTAGVSPGTPLLGVGYMRMETMQIVTYVQALFPLVVMLRSCPNMTLVVEWDFLMQCTGTAGVSPGTPLLGVGYMRMETSLLFLHVC